MIFMELLVLFLFLLFVLFCIAYCSMRIAFIPYSTYSLCWCVCIIISVDYGNLAVDFLYNLNIAQLAQPVYDPLFCAFFCTEYILYPCFKTIFSFYMHCICNDYNLYNMYSGIELHTRLWSWHASGNYLNCEAVLRRSADDWGAGPYRLYEITSMYIVLVVTCGCTCTCPVLASAINHLPPSIQLNYK